MTRKVKPAPKSGNIPRNIVKLAVQSVKINHDVIELLEETLSKAKSGEIVGLSVSWVTKDGSIGGDISESENGILMWASIEHNARSCYANIVLAGDDECP